MRKIVTAMILGGATLLSVGAKAAPPLGPVGILVAPHVQTVEWGGWGDRDGRGNEWREREWRRREAWERERQHEAWERHRWHEGSERPQYYGYGGSYR